METGALAVVGCVGVGREREGSICCVGMFKVTCKVPESSIVRGHDTCQLFDQGLCCFRSMGDIIDEGEPYDILQVRFDSIGSYNVLCPFSDSDTRCCGVHDFFVIYYGGVVCDLASPEGFAAVCQDEKRESSYSGTMG